MLEKEMMQRIQQFADFSLLPKEPSLKKYMRSTGGKSKIGIECRIVFSEICLLFLENHLLEFCKIWHKNTLGNKQLDY